MPEMPSREVLKTIVQTEMKTVESADVALEYSHVLVVAAKASGCLDQDVKRVITGIILNCQSDDGLFRNKAWDGPEMECASSAVRGLRLCGTYGSLGHQRKLADWVLSRQNRDGGFSGCPDWYKRCTAQPDLPAGIDLGSQVMPVRSDSGAHACYFAYQALDGMKALRHANLEALCRFLAQAQRADGSWGFHPDDPVGNTISTAMALHVLTELGQLQRISATQAGKWLISRQLSDGGFDWLGKGSWVLSTARASKALRLSGAFGHINRESFESYWRAYELKNCWDIVCLCLSIGHPLAMRER